MLCGMLPTTSTVLWGRMRRRDVIGAIVGAAVAPVVDLPLDEELEPALAG